MESNLEEVISDKSKSKRVRKRVFEGLVLVGSRKLGKTISGPMKKLGATFFDDKNALPKTGHLESLVNPVVVLGDKPRESEIIVGMNWLLDCAEKRRMFDVNKYVLQKKLHPKPPKRNVLVVAGLKEADLGKEGFLVSNLSRKDVSFQCSGDEILADAVLSGNTNAVQRFFSERWNTTEDSAVLELVRQKGENLVEFKHLLKTFSERSSRTEEEINARMSFLKDRE